VGTQRTEVSFDLPWVRVEVTQRGVDLGAHVKVELVSARQRVEVGRYLVDVRRAVLGQELRATLESATQRGM
jgi:uncharacterized membrane protein